MTNQNTEKPSRPPRGGRPPEEKSEFDSSILDLARVTRVTKGGKRMRFRSCVIIGDRRGRVGYGVAKGADVQQSVSKATTQARKKMIKVPVVGGTVPHEVTRKFAAATVLIKPAPEGTGIKAGGAVRVVLEMAGVPNVVAKIMGSNNKINNAKATMCALSALKGASKAAAAPARPFVARSRGEGGPKSGSSSRRPRFAEGQGEREIGSKALPEANQ